ncbi:PBP domain containing protein [Alkalidesulfovibrio alkalitolerans DSM 16529]|uniref:PBP domain containing protein n=1 Tax=Alkalidesulfovibrio alkalitolerans DSM 16529 TaxID=1121439 RepID=S7U9R8_9BACT|nr:substrate-binding domain-containing protein [Alkalidesulfovibrio alkalitolerans]EPR30674.1 PBP domain containing protein [Alkalidesulfovibrio alkalitolerans DSM 16529]
MRILSILALALFLATAPAAAQTLMMATTTSTEDTGLLDQLMPMFTQDTGIDIKWTSTGTGKALKMGENCDVDVLMVHAPAAEKKFVEDGFGTARNEFMYNDFVVVGPTADPAGIKGDSSAKALAAIASTKALFISRGDDSGTHKAEQTLWKKAELPLPDKETWYVQAGQGMMQTLMMAAERGGYALTDRGTYISYEAKAGAAPALVILVEGDDALKNQYSVIPVNPAKCPNAQLGAAEKLATWVASEKGQKAIAGFKLEGKQLFYPNAK